MFSHYRILWITVLFDLPVSTKKQRDSATRFRNALLNLGFNRVQFSIYMKHVANKEQAETVIKKVKIHCPEYGNVKILRITDKQFSDIIHLGKHEHAEIHSTQLALF